MQMGGEVITLFFFPFRHPCSLEGLPPPSHHFTLASSAQDLAAASGGAGDLRCRAGGSGAALLSASVGGRRSRTAKRLRRPMAEPDGRGFVASGDGWRDGAWDVGEQVLRGEGMRE